MRRRRSLVLLFALAVLSPAGQPAFANHCAAHGPGIDEDICNTPPPGQAPPKPTPTPTPTPKPATPTPATPRPQAPTTTRSTPRPTFSVSTSTPSPTPEVIDLDEAGPEIVVPGPVIDDSGDGQALDDTETAGNTSSLWLVTLVIGLIVGGLVGRASWGLSNRRRQQIFG